jgi:S1-C subfamily serine protease/predicted esterase
MVLVGLTLTWLPAPAQQPGGDDLNELQEKAIKMAVQKVSPSVVQIITSGGTDMVVIDPKGGTLRKSLGPTTGVIVGSDGYVISSAFNFVNSPTTIVVAVPGHKEPFVARRVATDRSRMLTLLKIEAKDLPVPAVAPKKDIRVGNWAVALGRTLDLKHERPPSVSVGIVSAVGRIWGKAIQTDCKVSPVNYGGPLIDIQGRVQGILIPASPQGEGEAAGFEWYDSGIGFAIPLEDVFAVLPRLKEGKDLKKGLLGVRFQSPDIYGAAPVIGEVLPDTAAARAGLKSGDKLTEIDGQPVVRMAQVMHALGVKYEGDKVALKYKRGDEEINLPNLELVGKMSAFLHPYLGILPMRDDPKLGVEIRDVLPRSPAAKAGLKVGDRIVKVERNKTLTPFTGQKSGRDEFFDILNSLTPETEIKLEVTRKDGNKTETVTVKLAEMPGATPDRPDTVPEKLRQPASKKQALEPLEVGPGQPKPAKVDRPDKKPETGTIKRTNASGDRKYWIYVPEDYDPNIAYALVIWLHPPGKTTDDDVEAFTDKWEDYCKDNHIIMVGPKSEKESGWLPSEADFVLEAVRDVMSRYTIDRQRVVTHGMGVGGQMALYLGLNHREVIRGVATTGAVVTGQVKDNTPNQRLAFFLIGGDRDPLVKAIAESKTKLVEHRFPVIYREIANLGRQYPDDSVGEIARWIDALDRQ